MRQPPRRLDVEGQLAHQGRARNDQVATSAANHCNVLRGLRTAQPAHLREESVDLTAATNYLKADHATPKGDATFAIKVATESHRIVDADFCGATRTWVRRNRLGHRGHWRFCAVQSANLTGMRPNDEFY